MREILYRFNTLGTYQTQDSTSFGTDSRVKLILEPHNFSIAIGGEVLRASSCKGYNIDVSHKAGIVFRDMDGNELCRTEDRDRSYREFLLAWKQGSISIQFGATEVIDHYPNCDGEYDRWSERWCGRYEVTLDEETNTITGRSL